MDKLSSIDIEHIAKSAKNGNKRAMEELLFIFKNIVKAKASVYYLIGGDREDLVQEGMIGLFKAIRDYDEKKSNNFYAFSCMCINRQILSAIKASSRMKHKPLNTSLFIGGNGEDDDSDEEGHGIIIADPSALNPETVLIDQETIKEINLSLKKHLSDFEYKVLMHRIQGNRRDETAKILMRDIKSIDNALKRIRKKAKKIFNNLPADT